MEALDYDFAGHFGVPGGSLAARAATIDRTIADWLDLHPDGLVISLGEGLETQARRVDNGRMRWLSVDLPEAIRLREVFLPSTDRFRHLAMSALDAEWMAMVNPCGPLFIVAQGLFMYLDPDAVSGLLGVAARHHPGSCSQTERIFARINCQWDERRAHIMRHCARHHRAVLANGRSCSQSLPMSVGAGFSETRVFERSRPNQKIGAENGLNLSQNTFLISASQKVGRPLSFERCYGD